MNITTTDIKDEIGNQQISISNTMRIDDDKVYLKKNGEFNLNYSFS